MTLEVSPHIFEKELKISNFIKIRLVGAELFHADEQAKGMTKLIVAFRNFARAPKNCWVS
jgi:hypothetical protein